MSFQNKQTRQRIIKVFAIEYDTRHFNIFNCRLRLKREEKLTKKHLTLYALNINIIQLTKTEEGEYV